MIVYILERLAVGTAADAHNAPENITAFLNLAEEVEASVETDPYRKIPIIDFSPVPPEQVSEAIQWINEHILQHTVLVFCNAGIQRSPSIAIAYLCSIGFGYEEALHFCMSKKPDITPVPNLLQSIEEALHFFL